jgi:hypothetical protein
MEAPKLFASRGFESVSVREITRALGLTGETLYIHFKNKAALQKEILPMLDTKLNEPDFRVPPPGYINRQNIFDPAAFIISGANTILRQGDRKIFLLWRKMMIGQYRDEADRLFKASSKNLAFLVKEPLAEYQ